MAITQGPPLNVVVESSPLRAKVAPVRSLSSEPLEIAWRVFSLDPKIASTRYRCLIPVRYLKKFAVKSRVYGGGDFPDLALPTAALVFVKTFTNDDLGYARYARDAGIPVILDLCDNIFFRSERDRNPASWHQVENFKRMSRMASCISTTGEELAEIIRKEAAPECPIVIIADPIETDEDHRFARQFRIHEQFRQMRQDFGFWLLVTTVPRLMKCTFRMLALGMHRAIGTVASIFQWLYWNLIIASARVLGPLSDRARYYQSVRRLMAQEPSLLGEIPAQSEVLIDRPRVLWFGNSGQNGVFGISDLAVIKGPLTEVYRQVPFELTVVSNSKEMYQRFVQPIGVPSRYVEWTPETMAKELDQATVVVLPNRLNAFSACKSANRALLALANGVPVVATRTSALAKLDGCVVFDDWSAGLRAYLTDPARRDRDVAAAKAVIEQEFSGELMAERWNALLRSRCDA